MYLDPGLGGMLVQLVVAIVAAGGAIVFMMRKKIRALFSKNKQSDTATADNADTSAQGVEKAAPVEDDAVDMLDDDKEE